MESAVLSLRGNLSRSAILMPGLTWDIASYLFNLHPEKQLQVNSKRQSCVYRKNWVMFIGIAHAFEYTLNILIFEFRIINKHVHKSKKKFIKFRVSWVWPSNKIIFSKKYIKYIFMIMTKMSLHTKSVEISLKCLNVSVMTA